MEEEHEAAGHEKRRRRTQANREKKTQDEIIADEIELATAKKMDIAKKYTWELHFMIWALHSVT